MAESSLSLNKIVVTGGAGFIGSHVVERLLKMGKEVLVIDNYSTGKPDNLKVQSGLIVIEGTIADSITVNKAFESFDPDVIIHAAASYSDPDNWEEDVASNIIGTMNIVRAGINHRVKRLVYLQTSLCYGLNPLEQPITLSHPYFSGSYSGGSSYAISKTAGELYIELSGLDFVSFRLANTYGPRNLTGPLPAFYSRIMDNKEVVITETRRDFIFVDDVVEGILKATAGLGKPGYYHLSTGKDYSIKDLFDETIRQLEIDYDKVSIKPKGADDVATILTDPAETSNAFGWEAKTSLRDGVARSIQYYKNFGLEKTYTHLKNIN